MTPQRITHAHVRELTGRLTPRDYLIIATLRQQRVATARQIERLWFTDGSPLSNSRMARRTLRRLVELRVLARIERPGGGLHAGSPGHVYTLDVAGLRLAERSSRRSPRRPYPVSRAFLDHALAVTEWYVRLMVARHHGGPDLLEFQAEPRSWRTFTSYAHGREVLKPDAFVSLVSGEWEDRYFLEIDRGTEHTPALRRQLDRYVRYWRSGQEQAVSEVFPGVLWIVPDAQRHAVLVDVIGRLPTEAWPIFRVSVEDEALQVLTGGAS
jgi:Replication-relaxation